MLSPEDFLDEISKLEAPILLEMKDDEGYEHTYLLSFPSMDELDGFLRGLSKLAHIKAVLKTSLTDEEGIATLPEWMTHVVTKYKGEARYNIMEKWMMAQES